MSAKCASYFQHLSVTKATHTDLAFSQVYRDYKSEHRALQCGIYFNWVIQIEGYIGKFPALLFRTFFVDVHFTDNCTFNKFAASRSSYTLIRLEAISIKQPKTSPQKVITLSACSFTLSYISHRKSSFLFFTCVLFLYFIEITSSKMHHMHSHTHTDTLFTINHLKIYILSLVFHINILCVRRVAKEFSARGQNIESNETTTTTTACIHAREHCKRSTELLIVVYRTFYSIRMFEICVLLFHHHHSNIESEFEHIK